MPLSFPVRAPVGALVLLLAVLLTAGCERENPDMLVGAEPVIVYLGTPLEGVGGREGRDILDGAKLALADAGGTAGPFEATIIAATDTRGRPAYPDEEASALNSRRAAQDPRVIGYIGDFHSESTRITLPVLNEGLVPQVSAGATRTGLTRAAPGTLRGEPGIYRPSGPPTFARLVPASDVQARAAAAWAREIGVETAWIARVRDEPDSETMARAFGGELRRLGGSVVGTSEVSSDPERRSEDLREMAAAGPDLVYVPSGRIARREPVIVDVARAAAEPLLMTAEAPVVDPRLRAALVRAGAGDRVRAVSPALPITELGEAGRELAIRFQETIGRPPGPYAAYGYEAMALLLDAVERAGEVADDRRRVVEQLLSTDERDSVLGRYSIGPDGDSSIDRVAGYRLRDGRPVLAGVIAPRGGASR